MLDTKKISVVLPCFNEEDGLSHVLRDMPDFINEVIVVDNNSTDNSASAALKYGVVVIREERKGYGSAILKGLGWARGDIIVVMDADGSYCGKKIKDLCIFLQEGGYDFVSGCRFPLDDKTSMPLLNKLSNYFISWLGHVLFNIKIKDLQSGQMAFKRGILDAVRPLNRGMGFSQEIKIKAHLDQSIRCGEMHVPYYKRIGRVKFRKLKDGLSNLRDLLRLFREEKVYEN